MSMDLTGDWEGFHRMLTEAGKKFKSEVQKATNTNGHLVEKTIKQYISGQKGSWKPLSEKYLKRKLKLGQSELILVMEGHLANAAKYQKISWDSGFVGVNRKETRKGYDIAWIMEYGSRDGRVPARPYIEPSLKQVEKDIVKNYEDAVDRAFK